MRKFFTAVLIILFAAQIGYAAPQTLDRATADSRARQTFELISTEGDSYSVRIIGEDEKLLTDWFWAKGDKIWTGNYFAYIARRESSTLTLQDVQVFAQNFNSEHPQRVNATLANRDGVHLVTGLNGMPDLLISKIQITGGGVFDVKIFVVKNGRLQQVKFIGDNGKLQDGRDSTARPTVYLADGTISVPWHTNVAPAAGSYDTVYMFDLNNLILIPAYTKKL